MDRRVVAVRAATPGSPEELILRRIVDDGDLADAVDQEGDRHAPVAHPVHEVDRAVDGVDEPAVRAQFSARLLTQHGVVRIRSGETRSNQCLDRVIGHAHEVLRAFGFGGEHNFVPEIAPGERPGFARESFPEFGAGANVLRRHYATAIGTTPWRASVSDTGAPAARGRSTAMLMTNNSPISVAMVYSITPPMYADLRTVPANPVPPGAPISTASGRIATSTIPAGRLRCGKRTVSGPSARSPKRSSTRLSVPRTRLASPMKPATKTSCGCS